MNANDEFDNVGSWQHQCPVTTVLIGTISERCPWCNMPRPGPARVEPAEPVMKYDAGKPPVDLVDPGFIIGVARVLGRGALKYAPNGWMRGMAVGKALAAAMRHLLARLGGQIDDAHNTDCPGDCLDHTGEPHLMCAACEIMFAAYYDRNSIVVADDRFKKANDK